MTHSEHLILYFSVLLISFGSTRGNDGLFKNKYDSDLEDDVIDNDTSNVNDGSDSIDNLVLNVRDEASPTARACADRLPKRLKCKQKLPCSKLGKNSKTCNRKLSKVRPKKCISKLKKGERNKKVKQYCRKTCQQCVVCNDDGVQNNGETGIDCGGGECPNCELCKYGYAYHSGTLVNGNAPANNAAECLHQCNILSNCNFWDFGGNFCRLRSNNGDGPQLANSYAYGPKFCNFESCPRPATWCIHTGATFVMKDCDGDGILDPVCSDNNGEFGVIQSSKGCIDSWPTGKCLMSCNNNTDCPSESPWCAYYGYCT